MLPAETQGAVAVGLHPVVSRRSLKLSDNKFHTGNAADGKHYWLTPPELYAELDAQYHFDFDPCPHPQPENFDGLTCEWGKSNYANIPFGAVIHQGKKKGATAWVRKAITEHKKGKRVVLVYPVDKWLLMLLAAGATVKNLGDVRWCATEDGSKGKGTGRHIACFVLEPANESSSPAAAPNAVDGGQTKKETKCKNPQVN
jgi:hypothetical protein